MSGAWRNGHEFVAVDANAELNGLQTEKMATAWVGASALIRNTAMADSIVVPRRRR
jgi:hypothetical protein